MKRRAGEPSAGYLVVVVESVGGVKKDREEQKKERKQKKYRRDKEKSTKRER